MSNHHCHPGVSTVAINRAPGKPNVSPVPLESLREHSDVSVIKNPHLLETDEIGPSTQLVNDELELVGRRLRIGERDNRTLYVKRDN